MTHHPKSAAVLALLLLGACNAPDAPVQTSNEAAQQPEEPSALDPTDKPAAEANAPVAQPTADDKVSPCLIQDGKPIPANRLKAIGTEPFWGARIEGRCVTYSTPEDQDGTRVWTQFTGTTEGGTWTGFLGDQRFVLRTRPEQGCSDGMSDNRYPIAVSLTVCGEERTGCAEPL